MRSTTIQLLLAVSFLQTVQTQHAFRIPDPDAYDFDSSNDAVQRTDTNIAWIANSTYQPTITGDKLLDDDGNISLWITSFDGNSYTHCITPSVNSKTGGTWTWNLTISDDQIDANGGKFVYRLKPTVASANAPFNTTEDECPSRGFRVIKASDFAASSSSQAAASSASVASAASASRAAASKSAQTTATGTTHATTTATAATTGAANTGIPTNTGSPSSSGGGGLSGGAKAGIAIGVVALVGLAALAAFFLFRRRRAAKSRQAAELSGTAQYAMVQDPKHVYGYTDEPHTAAPAELADSPAHPVELPAAHK